MFEILLVITYTIIAIKKAIIAIIVNVRIVIKINKLLVLVFSLIATSSKSDKF